MKTKVIVLVAFFLLLIIIGIILFNYYQNVPINGTLNVNGKDITDKNVVIHKYYAELPLTKVLEAIGLNIEWVDDNNAKVTYNDKVFDLNISEMSLTEVGAEDNFLWPAAGGTVRVCKSIEKDIILDTFAIKSFCYCAGINIKFRFDRDNSYVYLTESD